MGQQLRITFELKDYSFRILNLPVDKNTQEIKISLNGSTHTLIKEKQNWIPREENENISASLAKAIGKAISLRYRI